MMNRPQTARLVSILRDAMTSQGILQKELARHIGCSEGTLSSAFALRGQMREERWRMACELCGVDFDRFLDGGPTEQNRTEQNRTEQNRTEPAGKEESPVNTATVQVLTEDELYALETYILASLPHTIASEPDKWTFDMIETMVHLRDKLHQMYEAASLIAGNQ